MTDDLGRGYQRGLYRVAAAGAVVLIAFTAGALIHGRHENKGRGVQLLLNQAACSWETPGANGIPTPAGVWWGGNVPTATVEQLRAFDATATKAAALGARIAITGGVHAGVCTRFAAPQRRAFTAFRTLYR
ncbi:MAG TPA: hypothetical protein VGH52_08110 [Gaiellaceae bacterium]